jgi:flavin reductase (DIM6/NTAB) family NADH-FMN oxidoreductase RutF
LLRGLVFILINFVYAKIAYTKKGGVEDGWHRSVAGKDAGMKVSLPGRPVLLPSPVLIVGTYGMDGKPNLMNAAWGGIVSSEPPCIGVSLREATLSWHNIVHSKAFTVNIPSEGFVTEADFMGLVSGRDHDKLAEAGLTQRRSQRVDAPVVEEFPYALECSLAQQVPMGSHTLFIGRIVGLIANKDVLGANDMPDIEKVRPLVWGSFGSMGYYGIGGRIGDSFAAGKGLIRG